jgi:hypothetical protein
LDLWQLAGIQDDWELAYQGARGGIRKMYNFTVKRSTVMWDSERVGCCHCIGNGNRANESWNDLIDASFACKKLDLPKRSKAIIAKNGCLNLDMLAGR